MKWCIVTDSSCDLEYDYKCENAKFMKVPFAIDLGNDTYLDNEELNVKEFIQAMEASPEAGMTACPSPGAWYECYKEADNIIAITISSKLSGSHSSAAAAQKMLHDRYPDKKVCIIDSMSAGPALAMIVIKAEEYISANMDFEEVEEKLKEYAQSTNTVFVLSSFTNLMKSGRLSKLSGFVAGKLSLSGIGVAKDGLISMSHKTRGANRIVQYLMDNIKENNFDGGLVMISHCENISLAEKMSEEIKKTWTNARVVIFITGGLCSYYAEKNGIIIAY